MECAIEEDTLALATAFKTVSKPKVSNRSNKREVRQLTEREGRGGGSGGRAS